MCIDKFSTPFKSYLGEDGVYNFVNSMIEENKYCSDVLKACFNKEFEMTKKDAEDFESSTKCWIWDISYVDGDVKAKDHYHITGKYRGPAHRDCNIAIKINHKIPIVLHNLKNYDAHLMMQDLSKFSFKINAIPNGLEKYMSLSINKLIFIDSFQLLRFSIDSLVKNLGKDEHKYLSQEFHGKVLDLVEQKWIYPFEYKSDFEKFKEELPSKENFYSSLMGKKTVIKSMRILLRFGINLK